MSGRAKLFEEVPDLDLRRFAPKSEVEPAPALEQVRGVSAAAGFPTRDAVRAAPIAERHYYRYGAGYPVQYKGPG